jgi:hypothetical protein
MDQFTVPQFVEHEPKIVGPFTFKQFIFIGVAAAICFVFYFATPFYIFIVASIFLMAGAFSLAFLKSGGRSLPVVLKNFFFFSLSSKIYLWKKKGENLPPKLIEKAAGTVAATLGKTNVPAIAGRSRLNSLSAQVETKIKEQG